ncbi:MAG: type II asparaginase [Proteobacteria bacterium]|nr:type II asparaginase [Pseudomonadota bacterium]
MKILKIFSLFLLLFFSANANAKNIVILATGGTISGAGDSAVESQYSSSKIDIDQIIKNSPGINKLANIQAEQIMQLASQDMNSNAWISIAKKANEVLSQPSVDGVLITHGTDTMEETAYFLNLTIKSKKPVILVGSMRPSTSLSADGALNLYNAVALASSSQAIDKGVLILMNDEIFAARDAAKTHTTNVASFKANNSGAIGFVHYGKVEIYYNPLRTHTTKSIFDIKKTDSLPKVEIIFAYAGVDSSIVDYLVESNAKAIILAGVGDGNIGKASLDRLKEARKKGVVIVRSSHLGSGVVAKNAEINDDQLDFITADNLSPQKARVLTMLALTKTSDTKKIQEIFETY